MNTLILMNRLGFYSTNKMKFSTGANNRYAPFACNVFCKKISNYKTNKSVLPNINLTTGINDSQKAVPLAIVSIPGPLGFILKTMELKKYTSISILLLLGISLFSQEWAPIGSKWYYSLQAEYSSGYILVESIRDTIVQDKPGKILSQRGYGWTSPGYLDTIELGEIITYENEGAIYYLVDDESYVLFDFNADPGYSWTVKAPYMEGRQISDTTGVLKLDSTGVEIIGGQSFKTLYIANIEGCVGYGSTKVIEGVGPIDTYLFPQYIGCIIDAAIGGPLRCFHSTTIDYNTGISSICDYIPTSARDHKQDFTRIYPNPFTENFFIENTQNLELLVEIYTISGKLIDKMIIAKGVTMTISLDDDPSNIYILVMKSGDSVFYQKIIKR